MANSSDARPNSDEDGELTPSTSRRFTGGAVGAGLVLVVLPSLALLFGVDYLSRHAIVGLPLLAIFGIMILFGSMSLTSTLFARLNLSNRHEALALPTGSIRAAIALSLIVLFAIIAIMLFQSLAEPYRITGLTQDEQAAITRDPRNRVLAVRVVACGIRGAGVAPIPQGAASAPAPCYDVHLVQSAAQEAIDIAKQLLILVGTLMTSVTSFYFASRTAQSSSPDDARADRPGVRSPLVAGGTLVPTSAAGTANGSGSPSGGHSAPSPSAPAAIPAGQQPAPVVHATDDHDTLDGCDVAISDPTPDAELPAAKGGVVS